MKSIIYVRNFDGTPSGVSLADGDQNMSPAWSPDGSQLAYYREVVFRDENGDPTSRQRGIYVLQLSTGLTINLNATGGETPAYRPPQAQPEPTPGPAERIQNLINHVLVEKSLFHLLMLGDANHFHRSYHGPPILYHGLFCR